MAALGTRMLTAEIDGTEYSAQISNLTIDAADGDSDFKTFADARAGGIKDFVLKFTSVQDLKAGSLWRVMWDKTGEDVPVSIQPYGNTTPSTDEAHIEGTVTVSLPDGTIIGGEANESSTARMTFEVEWKFTSKPTLVTT